MRILITGSSSGIGRHLTESLWREGHHLWGWARTDQTGWAKELATNAGRLNTSQVDVSEWTAVETATRQIAKAWGQIDGLICCAGTQGAIGSAMKLDPLAWEAAVRANLAGTFFPVRAVFDLMTATRSGNRAKVVLFSGGGSTKARPNFSAYSAAKTAIVRLAETLAEEWRELPVDINAIAPGAIYTSMTEEILRLGPERAGCAEYEAALKLKKKSGAPLSKVSALIDYLLSPASDHLSGKLISAVWDDWHSFAQRKDALLKTDALTLRRILS